MRLARYLAGATEMQTLLIGLALAGSLASALILQRALLQACSLPLIPIDATNRLLAGAAAHVLQVRLAHFDFLALRLGDNEGAASQVLCFV